jgi:DNA-binding response OmpR family regulator
VRLKQRLQMSRVYTNITHELLTPLTVISASVERLREQTPEHSQDYDLMQLNIERMVRLLQQILETSKSQSGELKLRVAHGDVMQYIQRTALCIEPLMAKNKLEFSVSCRPESMMGWIDTDKLDKIIYNLLSNAAKYTNEYGHVQLKVRTNDTYDRIIIKVSDDGIGIPKDKQHHLFRRYYDGDYRRMQAMGTGLGLSLTRDLVYLHGGDITCESEEGMGSTFTVVLPINKESFSAAQTDEAAPININSARSAILDLALRMKKTDEEPAEAPLTETPPDEDAYKLLIVEDNVELLLLMQQLFSKHYQVLTAPNGEKALDIVANNEIDLIVSDVMMPVMDGYELTRRIKGAPTTSRLPIILLTAKTQSEDREEALAIGADDYVTKPFKMRDLELRINNIIENRKRIQAEFREKSVEQAEQEIAVADPTADQEFLKRAIDCVRGHLDDGEYDRDAFAADMGASASTLYNKLRSLTGMNVTVFIRDIRMKEARRIAQQQPEIRISDLAYRVGFQDPKYFATTFKKLYGVTPTEFLEFKKAEMLERQPS